MMKKLNKLITYMLNERNFKRAFFFFLRQNIDIDSFLKLNKFTQNLENDCIRVNKKILKRPN